MSIYLKIDGVKGSVTTSGYEGCIEVFGYSTEGSRSMTTNSESDRTVGMLRFNPIILHKAVDASSVALLSYFYDAKVIPEIVFNHVTTGTTMQRYLANTFKDVMISRYTESNGANGAREELELHFTVQEKSVTTLDASHKPTAPQITGFDSVKAKKL